MGTDNGFTGDDAATPQDCMDNGFPDHNTNNGVFPRCRPLRQVKLASAMQPSALISRHLPNRNANTSTRKIFTSICIRASSKQFQTEDKSQLPKARNREALYNDDDGDDNDDDEYTIPHYKEGKHFPP